MQAKQENKIKVDHIPCYSDNYSYFVHDGIHKD